METSMSIIKSILRGAEIIQSAIVFVIAVFIAGVRNVYVG